jgi:hypothetical protein
MQSRVFRLGNHLKIIEAIVSFVLVLVVQLKTRDRLISAGRHPDYQVLIGIIAVMS